MKFVCLLAIVGAASAAKFDFRRGDVDGKTATGDTGTVAATAACKCGKNAVAVAIGEHCFVKDNKNGVMSANAVPACTTAQSDGKTAPGGNGCYCGKSGALTAADRFCSTALDATGAGIVSAGTTPFCTGTATTGEAAAAANCLCGSQAGGAVTCAATKYCFVKADFVGLAQTDNAIKACTTAQSDGKTAPGGNGCYCGKSGALTAADRFCSTALD